MTSAALVAIDAFLVTARDTREYKRALVVQLCERGYRAAEVARLLQVSEAFVSTCRKRYAEAGSPAFSSPMVVEPVF